MAELSIEVTGCGIDSNCAATYLRFSRLVNRWYGDRVDLNYVPDDMTDKPLIIVKEGGQEVCRWKAAPTAHELEIYLTSKLGLPAGLSRRPEPTMDRSRDLSSIPPWYVEITESID